MDIQRLHDFHTRIRSVQWEGWCWHHTTPEQDRLYRDPRNPHDGQFFTISRGYGKPQGSDAEILSCIKAAKELSDRLRSLHDSQKTRERLSEEERHDFDRSSRAMALYGALQMGGVIRSLESALTASTVRDGQWYALARRAERAQKAAEQLAVQDLVDGPLAELR